MSENQKNKLITWIKTQWSMPGYLGKAKIIGITLIGLIILSAIFLPHGRASSEMLARFKQINSYEKARELFPSTLSTGDLMNSKDLNALSGKTYLMSPIICGRSLGAGNAIMKLNYYDLPIKVQPLNPVYEKTIYVENQMYHLIVRIVGPTEYKNIQGINRQALLVDVIYCD